MKFSEIIQKTIQITGLENEVSTDTASEKLDKLIDSANMIYSELTLGSVHLKTRETLSFEGGRLYYTEFGQGVREVLSVKKDGTAVPFTEYALYIEAPGVEGEAEVTYIYFPETLALTDTVVIPPRFTAAILAIGAASEYFYRSGLIDEAVFYKNRYDTAVANLTHSIKGGKLPKRRLIW